MAMDIYEEKVCPVCRLNTGMNYYLKHENGIYVCPNDKTHTFKINREGYLERIKQM
ncbi:MAG: hypothetical protein N3G74_00355 [Candidatus Micrarchaeota archaeon]|nr:hypothetical protein [Candidatus Micrarchaeota archaeon]